MLHVALTVSLWSLGQLVSGGTLGVAPALTPQGELGARIALVQQRMETVETPAFTDDFILADVVLDPGYPRRFSEYSGDVSGRYFGAVACLPTPALEAGLPRLVATALEFQREDGRFGTPALSYAAEDVTNENMKLLWGNGRLLVGLMEYYASHEDPAVLASAQRLGDFLVATYDTCTLPDVVKRLEGQGASGFICFTQLIEGLDLLWQATKDDRYLETAKAIVPLLEERGVQHSHGYLSTLRGYMMLYTSTADPQFLEAAKSKYDALIASDDYTLFGGVLEYFGHKNDRDEGCSEADFLRLSLLLWRATGDEDYLERAERCLFNEYYANQFETGDFGHRRFDSTGQIPAIGAGRAWWCCTMHGLRAFRDVLDCAVTTPKGIPQINIYVAGLWSGDGFTLTLSRPAAATLGAPSFRVKVEQAPADAAAMDLRVPAWAQSMTLRINGETASARGEGGMMHIERAWRAGDVVDVDFDYQFTFHTRDGKTFGAANLTDSPREAALYYGPWLLGVDEIFDPMFHGEPWQENVIHVAPSAAASAESYTAAGPGGALAIGDARLVCDYVHGGFPDMGSVCLRPVSEQTPHAQAMMTTWLRFRAK